MTVPQFEQIIEADDYTGRPVALLKIADAPPSNRTVDVIDENNHWRLADGISGFNHYWSVDGVDCLWCARQRTAAEIAIWFAAGKPAEACPPRLLP